ncbi:hypothetical protein ABT403_14640 [Streptomyces sp. NPDC000075]|uniref:hypothetical protein n=1 Tax=Streptomyces TaxID=1883 RepID=UPI0031D0DF2E
MPAPSHERPRGEAAPLPFEAVHPPRVPAPARAVVPPAAVLDPAAVQARRVET